MPVSVGDPYVLHPPLAAVQWNCRIAGKTARRLTFLPFPMQFNCKAAIGKTGADSLLASLVVRERIHREALAVSIPQVINCRPTPAAAADLTFLHSHGWTTTRAIREGLAMLARAESERLSREGRGIEATAHREQWRPVYPSTRYAHRTTTAE